MINALLLCLSVSLGASKNVFSHSCPSNKVFAFNSYAAGMAFIILLMLAAGDGLTLNPYIYGFAILYASFTLLAQVTYIKALSIGDFSISTLIYSCGFIIPSILGAIIFKETVTIFQIIGLVVIVASFVVGNLKRSGGKKSILWLLLCLTAFFASGTVGLGQKLFRASNYSAELDSMLTVSFLFICAASSVLSYVTAPPERAALSVSVTDIHQEKKLLLFAILMGIVMFAQNKTNLYLSGALPSMLFFPVCNGGTIALSAVCDRIIFKKKMIATKIASIVLGIIGIVLTVL